MGLTYKEFMELALEHYNEGGDCVYECWEEYQFDDYVKEFGSISKEKAMKLFSLYKSMRSF